MPDELAPSSEPKEPRPTEYAPSFQTVYSNAASMIHTPFDIRVNFGLSKPRQAAETIDGPTRMVNELQVTVLMSPQHAKVFALIFVNEIRKWENQFGPIPISAEFAERVGVRLVSDEAEGDEALAPADESAGGSEPKEGRRGSRRFKPGILEPEESE